MAHPVSVVINGRGLTDFGFVGNPNVDGVGLATRGLVWLAGFIWITNEASVSTTWISNEAIISTVWTKET